MKNSQTCPVCGAPLATSAWPSHCPACLLKLGLAETLAASESADTLPAGAGFPKPFGDYQLLALIDEGGMGAVYREIGRAHV